MRDELWQGASEESDRGFVIVSHTYLDESLAALCKAAFEANEVEPKLITKLLKSRSNEGPPPLQGFWMKAVMAHAFGLIESHIFNSLVELNTLRNTRGAHSSKRYALRDEDVRRIVGKLEQNLAKYITGMADEHFKGIEDFRETRVRAKAKGLDIKNLWEKSTYARCLLESYVFVVAGMIEGKAKKLSAKG